MLLKDILATKGTAVLTIQDTASLSDVVQELVKHNIGSLIVCAGETMVGIITERDILKAVAQADIDLLRTPVRERMSVHLITAAPDDEVETVMGLMTQRRFRHLPVLENGKLAGMISIGDLVKAHHALMAIENQQLRSYIQS
jgi:CBS domain-containing protein